MAFSCSQFALSCLRRVFYRLGSGVQGICYLHRGVVLSIDVICAVLAGALAYAAATYCLRAPFVSREFYGVLGMSFVLSTAIFLFSRFYKIIIRHASLRSLPRIVVAVLVVALLQGGVCAVCERNWGDVLLFSGLFYLFACSFIVGVRIMMVGVYYSALRAVGYPYEQSKRSKVFLCGSTDVCGELAKAFDVGYGQKYRVVGIVDPGNRAKDLHFAETRVYGAYDLEVLKRDIDGHVPEAVIFVDKNALQAEDERLVSWCNMAGVHMAIIKAPEDYGATGMPTLKPVCIEDLLERDEIVIEEERIEQIVKGCSVMVTGAAGSIGSEIVRQLCKYEPKCVCMIDCAETPLHLIRLEIEEKYPKVQLHALIADVRNRARCSDIVARFAPSIILHAAAYKHVPLMEEHPCEAILNNVVGSVNMADIAVEHGVERFVMVSTDKAVNPTNVMGATKRVSCMYVQALNAVQNTTKFITTRFGNVLGSNGSVFARFAGQIASGGPVTVTHPDIVRYFMTIPEACRLVLQAATMGEGGEIFVFDMGKPINIAHMARRMIRLAGLKPNDDIRIEYTGLRPGEKLHEEVLASAETSTATQHHKIRIARARRVEFDEIKAGISELTRIAHSYDAMSAVRQLKQLIPEYKSENSPFEQLDAPN